MHKSDTQIKDVIELKKIFKKLIKLLNIIQKIIFNSKNIKQIGLKR